MEFICRSVAKTLTALCPKQNIFNLCSQKSKLITVFCSSSVKSNYAKTIVPAWRGVIGRKTFTELSFFHLYWKWLKKGTTAVLSVQTKAIITREFGQAVSLQTFVSASVSTQQ